MILDVYVSPFCNEAQLPNLKPETKRLWVFIAFINNKMKQQIAKPPAKYRVKALRPPPKIKLGLLETTPNSRTKDPANYDP